MAIRTTVAAAGLIGAALLASPWVATAAGTEPAPAVPSATTTSAAARAPAPRGSLAVTVPPVLFGRSDALPAAVRRGGTYTADIVVLPASPGSRARASVLATGAIVTGCPSRPLPANVVTHLSCRVQVLGGAGTHHIVLVVLGRGGDGTWGRATYRHEVVR